MARRVHFLGMLASIVAVCLLSFCLMSGTGVFVLKESFYKRVETHGAKYGFDRSYGIGLLKDSEGHGWMNEETLLSIDGCTDHAIKGENAGWFALAGTALAALCVVVHPVGVFYDKCMLRFVLSLLCGFSSVCCGLSFWFLLSIYQDPMPCTRGIDDFNNSTDVDNVALSNVFDRSIVFPLLIVAGGLCAVSGLVMLISVLCCFKVCPANDGYNASVEKDIELKEISQINEESHTQEGVNEQNPQV